MNVGGNKDVSGCYNYVFEYTCDERSKANTKYVRWKANSIDGSVTVVLILAGMCLHTSNGLLMYKPPSPARCRTLSNLSHSVIFKECTSDGGDQ